MAKTRPTPRARLEVRPRRERGAAAVEFALLVPLLFLVLFGIIDYGLWFNDSLNVRQGVREAARQGIVQNYGGSTSPACTGAEMTQLACRTKQSVGAVTGPTYVKVHAPGGWQRGKPLLVCAMVKAGGLTGFVPLPADGLVKSKTRMSIENLKYTAPTVLVYADSPPAGGDWSWCV